MQQSDTQHLLHSVFGGHYYSTLIITMVPIALLDPYLASVIRLLSLLMTTTTATATGLTAAGVTLDGFFEGGKSCLHNTS